MTAAFDINPNPMNRNPFHLVVVISGHGFGHAAMTAPVVQALRRRFPKLRLTIKSSAPAWFLKRCFAPPLTLDPTPSDFGMVMHDAFGVDRESSFRAYRDAHRRWRADVQEEGEKLRAMNADLVLSNVAYRPLLAARQAGIPAVAYCCLNWAEVFWHYFQDQPGAAAIHQHMLEAYASAELFLRPEPAMPMNGLDTHSIGPVARVGVNRYTELIDRLQLPDTTRFVLASLGGIQTHLRCQAWPSPSDVHYLVPEHVEFDRPDMSALEKTGITFTDAMQASAALITKPGYGSFTEAACSATPVLFAQRDWPEQPYLVDWLSRHVPCRGMTAQHLAQGEFEPQLETLLAAPRATGLAPRGIEEAVECLSRFIA